MDYPGNLLVVAAPSGAGKSSLVRALLAREARVRPSVSHTTRAARGQEENGREYFFITDAEFDRMVGANGFVEWAVVHNHRYGTSRAVLEQHMAEGCDVILEIDYQGALQIKTLFANAVTVFILPPSWQELRARLQGRAEDSESAIEQRLKNAAVEVAQVRHFDFVIINASFDEALFDLQAIVHSQRLRCLAQARAKAEIFKALHIL